MPAADGYVDPYRTAYGECPLCAGTDLAVAHEQDWTWRPDYRAPLASQIRWLDCRGCGHQFTWGYHTAEALDILFGHAQAGQTAAGWTAAQIESARGTWTKVVDHVTAFRADGRWLDVGAGAGMLASLAHECGFDVATTEKRSQVADALTTLGLEVLPIDVHELAQGPAAAFDVISLCDVLEHIPFPLPVLDAVTHALTPGGVLFVSCPNRDSLAWRALDAEGVNPYWSEIEHHHNFTFRTLRALLTERGYAPVTCSASNRYRVCMDVTAVRGPAPHAVRQ